MGFETPAAARREQPEDADIAEIEAWEGRWLLGGFPIPTGKSEALADSQKAFGKPGSMKYWTAKLGAEGTPVPQDPEAFAGYVNERIAATKHWLARQKALSHLHEELERIEAHEDVDDPEAEHVRDVTYENGALFAVSSRGERMPITVGDVAADRLWGLTFRPDASVPPELWSRIRRLSAIRGARIEFEDLTNRELAEREGLMLPTSSWSNEQIAEQPKTGVIAERMVQTLLSRIQYDHPELGMKVEASNVIEDIELKYDFKVTFSEHRRGVAFEGPPDLPRDAYVEEKRTLGIQFTTNDAPEMMEHKAKQIRYAKRHKNDERYDQLVPKPVDDIVLVAVSLEECTSAFRRWQKSGRPPGGPEQHMSEQAKLDLIKAMFKGRMEMTDDELRTLVSRARD
jgi:hypothetical protein